MENPDMGNVFAHEHDEERKLFIERWGLIPEPLEVSIIRMEHLRERAFYFWTNSMSGTATA